MTSTYQPLFEPLQIGSITIPNRFVMCAMEGTNIIEGIQKYEFNEHCRDYYLERAKSGIGLMIPGMVPVRNLVFQKKWLYQEEKIFMGPVKDLLSEIHQYYSKVFLQLGAGMGRSMTAVEPLDSMVKSKVKKTVLKAVGMDFEQAFQGPDAELPNVWDPDIRARQMTTADIERVIDGFAKSAALAKRAGFDGIEIHALHDGYLLDQFAMSATNHRTDRFGGSLENRTRFATEIIRAIKDACGEDYPVSMRFSVESKMIGFNVGAVPGEEYEEFGRTREESVKIAQLLADAGLDLLDADNGTYDSWYWAHPPTYMPLACNLDAVSYLKQHTDLPVVCAGRMELPEIALDAVASGKIDAVGIARQFLADGQYVSKIRSGDILDIRPCIACHNGCFGVYRYKGLPAGMSETPLGRCAINPVTFNEQKYAVTPAETPRRVAVVGGGIGGMEVARLAAQQGHQVSLYEASGVLGGVFTAAAAPSFKEKDRMLIDWYLREVEKLPIDVHLNTPIDDDALASLEADEIIIATGATPRDLPIPGIDSEHVMEAIEYLSGAQPITGEDVVILGGGLTGCEIAYDLALAGITPIIVEMQDDLLKVEELSAANSNMLRDLIRHHEIPVHLNSRVTEIGKDNITVATPEGSRVLPASTVIVSAGYVPGAPLAEAAERMARTSTPAPRIQIVGDAVHVGNLKHVIWNAYDVALTLSK